MPKSKAEENRERTDIEELEEPRDIREYIRYVGGANVRSISKDDLRDAGFSGESLVDLSWDKSNQWIIPRSDIPDDVYDRAIRPDIQFVIVRN